MSQTLLSNLPRSPSADGLIDDLLMLGAERAHSLLASASLVPNKSTSIDSSGYPYVLRDRDLVIPPLEQEPSAMARQIARAPVVDRFPLQLGQQITAGYLATAYRLAVTGWRYQFVDLLNELLDYDPHTRAVSRQRVIATAGGRVEIRPARLAPNDPQTDLAKEIADGFEADFENIPARTQAIGQLNWGCFYGISALEIEWEIEDKHWFPVGLTNIHTRRLNYPNPTDWELYIYDQGLVGPGMSNMGPTVGMYGLRVTSVPGKFIVHTPALNADYPTRDGEGRYVGMYMLLKRMIVRATAQDFERTIRPWVIGYYNRQLQKSGDPAFATPEDTQALDRVLSSLGAGSLNWGRLPNSVSVEILRAASTYSIDNFLSFLNREISKGLLGQSFTTESGANGNFSTAEIAKAGTMEILRYDARTLCDTFERDLARTWLRLNHPGVSMRLCPRIGIAVDELPGPKDVASVALQLTQMDVPVDVESLCEKTNTKYVQPDDPEAPPLRTRMVAAGKGPTPMDEEEPQPDQLEQQQNADGSPKELDGAGADGKSKRTGFAPRGTKPNGKASGKPSDTETDN